MKLKMTQDNVLIRQVRPQEVTQGGIILPQEKQMRPEAKGTVESVGPKVRELAVGDVVLFGDYAGQELDHGGEHYIILKEGDVLSKEIPD